MQFIRSFVVGVLTALYLWAESWCHYIPEKKATAAVGGTDKIQICGNALTTFIIDTCDGIVGSFNQVSHSRESVQAQIAEDCCKTECTKEYLQNYCGDKPLFSNKNIRPRKSGIKGSLKSMSRSGSSELMSGGRGMGSKRRSSKGAGEVSQREKGRNKNGGRRESELWGVSRKKRKMSVKRKCAYKSFGHYLLKVDRAEGAWDHKAKTSNNINRTWPSIEIGTVSPEIDKFGGQPIVMVKKNKLNSV